jgi:hypothetical protein
VSADDLPERIVAEILVRKIPEDQQAIGLYYQDFITGLYVDNPTLHSFYDYFQTFFYRSNFV